METEGIRKPTAALLPVTARHGVRERKARGFCPQKPGPFVIPTKSQFRRTVLHVYLVVLLISNALLVYIGGELVDLYVSSVELWAELARKHLELTL